jgi:2-amino-4-hydroxy-6-hydroxymethyldihydropteridine diphosphokinase
MILLGVGANLPSRRFGSPRATCEAALKTLSQGHGITVIRRSRWYRSAPQPASDQPWFVNGVALIETGLAPDALLELLHRVEKDFGRIRGRPNAARPLDLDLLTYGESVRGWDGPDRVRPPILPHPRLHERAFVLRPLADIAPEWCHPVTRQRLDKLIALLPPDQLVEPLVDDC